MTKEQARLLRRAVKAEIEYHLAQREEGSDGYRSSAKREEREADIKWNDLIDSCDEAPA